MEQKNNLRQLHILFYLYKNTDEDHMARTADIINYLADKGGTDTQRRTQRRFL